MKKQNSDKTRNIIFNIVVILSMILFAIAISPKSLQNDTFYTIKIGEYIYQNGISDLTQDLYSWHELPYTYPHWLYDLGIYLIYHIAGQPGIYISTIIFVAVLGWTIYLASTKFSKNKVVAFVLTILTMYLLKPYLAARAQLVTFILFSLTVYFIERLLETHQKRYAIPLFIIPILITNLHCAVFPFYFVLFLPYIGEYLWLTIIDWDLDYRLIGLLLKIIIKLPVKKSIKENCQAKLQRIPAVIERKKEKREKRRENPYKIKVRKDPFVKWLIVIAILAGFTGFINPAGSGAYTYTYKIYQGNTTDSINEHLPVTLIDSKEFLCALCLFAAILVFTDTKIKLSDLFMLGGLVLLALMSRRQISMFAIFCCPILVKLISAMFEKYDKNTCYKLFKFATSILGILIILLVFSIYTVDKQKDMKRRKTQYIDENTYPVQASDWILENLDAQNLKLYNEYNYGSYLLFRGIPVFIDSRCDLYSPEFNENKEKGIEGRDIFSDALNIAGISLDYDKKFEEYGVTHVIAYSNSKLVMLLKENDAYKKIYEDDHFAIFERL